MIPFSHRPVYGFQFLAGGLTIEDFMVQGGSRYEKIRSYSGRIVFDTARSQR